MPSNPFRKHEVAKAWIQSIEGEAGHFREKYIYPILQDWLSNSDLRRVLDAGCGQGIATSFCEGKEYYGVDPSEELIKRAIEQYQTESKKFVQGDMYNLPFLDSFFDGAFSLNVWFHIGELSRASEEFARVIRKNGGFLIVSACPESYDFWKSKFRNFKIEGKRIVGEMEIPLAILPENDMYLHEQGEILVALESSGLQLKDTAPFARFEEQNIFQYYKGTKN